DALAAEDLEAGPRLGVARDFARHGVGIAAEQVGDLDGLELVRPRVGVRVTLLGLRPHDVERAGIEGLAAERREALRAIGVRERAVRAPLGGAPAARGLDVAVECSKEDAAARQRGHVFPEPEADDRAQWTRPVADAALVVGIVDGDGLLAAA